MTNKLENFEFINDTIYFGNSEKAMKELGIPCYVQLFLAYYGLPALLRIRPSNLIYLRNNFSYNSTFLMELENEIKRFNCNSYVLYEDREIKNVLIYNDEGMNKLLESPDVVRFLTPLGYSVEKDLVCGIFEILKSRFEKYHNPTYGQEQPGFPHEIGAILGYPLNDVEDFIRYRGSNYILCGCWKVYHNAEQAYRVFEYYKKFRKYAIWEILNGKSLEDVFEMFEFDRISYSGTICV